MSKDYAMALYSDINMALDREDEIYNQIDDLNKELSDIKTIMPEIREFDFELFKLRFQGDFLILCGVRETLKDKIFTTDTEDSFYVYKSLFKSVSFCESELNLKVELMKLIKDYIRLPVNQISNEMIKDFKLRAKHILIG